MAHPDLDALLDATHQIRAIEAGDSIAELTELLHRAYASLAELGLRYKATDQDADTTRSRLASGEGYLLVEGARVLGTILVIPPSARAPYCEWYDRPDVAVLSQLAIEPTEQRRGLGSVLLRFAEARARALGACEAAVDTA